MSKVRDGEKAEGEMVWEESLRWRRQVCQVYHLPSWYDCVFWAPSLNFLSFSIKIGNLGDNGKIFPVCFPISKFASPLLCLLVLFFGPTVELFPNLLSIWMPPVSSCSCKATSYPWVRLSEDRLTLSFYNFFIGWEVESSGIRPLSCGIGS